MYADEISFARRDHRSLGARAKNGGFLFLQWARRSLGGEVSSINFRHSRSDRPEKIGNERLGRQSAYQRETLRSVDKDDAV